MRHSSENISQSQQQIISDEILASQLQVEEQENRRLEELDERRKSQEEMNTTPNEEEVDRERILILEARREEILKIMNGKD
ncbi:hypothetical protein NF27_HI00020, partial [Candidatus Jidaibacter acanthamoeba]